MLLTSLSIFHSDKCLALLLSCSLYTFVPHTHTHTQAPTFEIH